MNKPEIVLPDTKINFIRFLYLVLALEDTGEKKHWKLMHALKGHFVCCRLELETNRISGKMTQPVSCIGILGQPFGEIEEFLIPKFNSKSIKDCKVKNKI